MNIPYPPGSRKSRVTRPLAMLGRAVQWVLNETIRRRRKVSDLPGRLLNVRDFVRATIGRRWKGAVVSASGSTALTA